MSEYFADERDVMSEYFADERDVMSECFADKTQRHGWICY